MEFMGRQSVKNPDKSCSLTSIGLKDAAKASRLQGLATPIPRVHFLAYAVIARGWLTAQ